MTRTVDDPFVGQVVDGRYEVVARIGRGAMGAIYEVRHTRLKRSFALKRLMSHLADDKEALERFQQEADVVAALRHPHVVEIVDWETLADGTPCIVMELLRGENLEERIQRVGQLAWPELFTIADQVLSALAVAHRAGIVHRDLKPQNIYLARDDSDEERVKLLDFGISKVRGVSQTGVGAVIGTPAYMAPEQADSRHADISAGTDLWAMGAILYELATGGQPFTGDNASSVLYKVCYSTPEPIAKRRADVPASFEALVARLLDRSVSSRLADADELRRALRAVASAPGTVAPGVAVESPPAGQQDPPANSTTLSRAASESSEVPAIPRTSRRAVWAAAGVVLLLGAGIAFRPTRRESGPDPTATQHPVAAAPAAPSPAATPTTVTSSVPVAAPVSAPIVVPVPVVSPMLPLPTEPAQPLVTPSAAEPRQDDDDVATSPPKMLTTSPNAAVSTKRLVRPVKRPAKKPRPAEVRPLEP